MKKILSKIFGEFFVEDYDGSIYLIPTIKLARYDFESWDGNHIWKVVRSTHLYLYWLHYSKHFEINERVYTDESELEKMHPEYF